MRIYNRHTHKNGDKINCRIVVSYTLPCRCSFPLSLSTTIFFFPLIFCFNSVCPIFFFLEKRVTRQLIVVVRFLMKHERLPKHRRLFFFLVPFFFWFDLFNSFQLDFLFVFSTDFRIDENVRLGFRSLRSLYQHM